MMPNRQCQFPQRVYGCHPRMLRIRARPQLTHTTAPPSQILALTSEPRLALTEPNRQIAQLFDADEADQAASERRHALR